MSTPTQRVYAKIPRAAVIARNNFRFKSLSDWSYNISLGCKHGCTFCYVPQTSTIKQEIALEKIPDLIPTEWVKERVAGRHWGDHHWGEYSFLRAWDQKKFLSSLKRAQKAKEEGKLSPDGNAAIMFCTTTDPYQSLPGPNARILKEARTNLVRKALELILTKSDLNVRILTRSPAAKKDFDLYKRFAEQNRILFGMSIPTLDDTLREIYEPGAPPPKEKMETLTEAVEQGIPIYVALAPSLPDEEESALRNTLEKIIPLKPFTIFHEPINLRAENLSRIEAKAKSLGRTIRSDVFQSLDSWREYAFEQCALVDKIANELKIPEGVLHQWPDKSLSSKSGYMRMKRMQARRDFRTRGLSAKQRAEAEREWMEEKLPWIEYWHNPSERISAWPPERPEWR